MGKVVINTCYGGFGLSEAEIWRYAELKGVGLSPYGRTCLFLENQGRRPLV
jgi:hypothetical protein